MKATNDELNRLKTLIAAYPLESQLRGEMVFGAVSDEGRFDTATQFFDDTVLAEMKTSGLRTAIIDLLDELMVERSQQGDELSRDGILKLHDDKVALEWLPEESFQDAADARRDSSDLVPWLTERLRLVQHEAIERKKAKAAEKDEGDTSRWKREIWRSPEKNREIKALLAEEGQRLGFQVLPAGKRGEWLYDLVWRRLDADGNLIGMPLAVEIEMSDENLGGIRYDFNKLLQAQADHKLMVFQLKTPEEVEAAFERLQEAIDAYPHADSCRYLLCGWSTQKNEFYFRRSEASAEQVAVSHRNTQVRWTINLRAFFLLFRQALPDRLFRQWHCGSQYRRYGQSGGPAVSSGARWQALLLGRSWRLLVFPESD